MLIDQAQKDLYAQNFDELDRGAGESLGAEWNGSTKITKTYT